MLVSGNKFIKGVEKQLTSFRKYSFNNYSRLMLILVNYISFLENEVTLSNKQAQTDLLFELREEIELLHNIRHERNKNDIFRGHVETALTITRRIDDYLPVEAEESRPQRTILLEVLKRFFISSLKHT